MKRRKVTVKVKERELDITIYTNGAEVEIVRDIKGNLFFKVGKELSNDLAEGVSLLMRNKRLLTDSDIWSINIKNNGYNIYPEKALYWLTGGDSDWNIKDTYKKTWGESYSIYQEKYAELICDIIQNSRTLGDIKYMFIRELNILDLYEFALSKNIA